MSCVKEYTHISGEPSGVGFGSCFVALEMLLHLFVMFQYIFGNLVARRMNTLPHFIMYEKSTQGSMKNRKFVTFSFMTSNAIMDFHSPGIPLLQEISVKFGALFGKVMAHGLCRFEVTPMDQILLSAAKAILCCGKPNTKLLSGSIEIHTVLHQ